MSWLDSFFIGLSSVQVGGAAQVKERALNLIAGTNVTLSPADDASNGRTNITIASTGGGGSTPTGTGFVHVVGGVQDGAARTVDLASGDVTGLLPLANQAAPSGSLFAKVTAGVWNGASSAVNLATADVTGVLPLSNEGAPTGTGIVKVSAGVWAASGAAVNLAGAEVTGVLPLANEAAPTGTGIPHVVAGVYSAATSLIVNADVDGAAAIAGSKITGATTGAVGVVQLTNDLGGTSTAPTVIGITQTAGDLSADAVASTGFASALFMRGVSI